MLILCLVLCSSLATLSCGAENHHKHKNQVELHHNQHTSTGHQLLPSNIGNMSTTNTSSTTDTESENGNEERSEERSGVLISAVQKGITSVSELERIIECLREEKFELMKRLYHAEGRVEELDTLLTLSKKYAEKNAVRRENCGKNAFRKNAKKGKKYTFEEDKTNLTYINEAITEIFRGLKFKPKTFHIYTTKPGTFCQQVCAHGLAWPKHCTEKHYWEKSIVPIINAKYSNLVGNFTQGMKDVYLGMQLILLLLLILLFVFYSKICNAMFVIFQNTREKELHRPGLT